MCYILNVLSIYVNDTKNVVKMCIEGTLMSKSRNIALNFKKLVISVVSCTIQLCYPVTPRFCYPVIPRSLINIEKPGVLTLLNHNR